MERQKKQRTVMEVAQELDYLVRARYPFVAVETYEEARVLSVMRKIAATSVPEKQLYVWNCSRGLWRIELATGTEIQNREWKDVKQPQRILTWIEEQSCPPNRDGLMAIYVLQDFQMFIGKNPAVDRQIKDLVTGLQGNKATVIVTGTAVSVPPDLEKHITLIDFPLPDRAVLKAAIEEVLRKMPKLEKPVPVDLDETQKAALVEASTGLTVTETRNALGKAAVKKARLDTSAIEIVTSEKKQIIRKSGILEFYAADESLADIGGLDLLKRYIEERDGWWSEEAQAFGMDYLKGIVLIGIPGTGKSLTAKTMASTWGLPLIRLDMSAIYAKYVGSSESNIRKAIQTAESVAPCVLWVDEVEKAMASGSGDNGTSRRVFGQFLTWLQEKTSPVFVACTANDVSQLPPEFLRKGRVDDLYFVDLPTEEELVEILDIHVRKRGREMSEEDRIEVAKACEGYSGAEIEAAVQDALWKVYRDKGELTKDVLIECVKATKPLSRTMGKELASIKEWAKGRVRFASTPADESVRREAEQSMEIEVQ
jgi:SpoVK/Ycf46/Vps4 family AAA+-type ATPase